ncbi:MAG: hypothetical protein HEEMFOPI_01990 [Holosporales bacterium]
MDAGTNNQRKCDISTGLITSESAALNTISTNVQLSKIVVTHPTCLNPKASGGYSLEERLEIAYKGLLVRFNLKFLSYMN